MRSFIRLVALIVLIAAIVGSWRFLGPNTNFSGEHKSFYIKTGSSFEEVVAGLEQQSILKNPGSFAWLAKKIGYEENIHPGRYVIKQGTSIYKVLRLLNSGKQTAVDFVITKLRTNEDLAQKIGENFECDSATFMALITNSDSMAAYGLNTNTIMTAIIPNSYDIYWNTSPYKLFRKLYTEQERFWNDDRKQKATNLNLSTEQVYTLASIVEEETNVSSEKEPVASVYINRLKTGMRLEADPTIKFALRNFGLKRIYKAYIDSCASSPYNTYTNKGLPPGPICTASSKTIDAVLNAPPTDYLYFVAQPNFSGRSNFTGSYAQHLINKKLYIDFLDSLHIH